MRKTIKTILILIVLFVFPAACWYFLQTGLNWRKAKAIELKVKDNVINAYSWNSAEQKALSNLLKNKTSLIRLKDSPLSNIENEIIDQFKSSNTFNWISLSETLDVENSAIATQLKSEIDYILIDTAMNIRQTYKIEGEENLRKMVEDIALMIPKVKPLDIKMKNEDN